MNNDTNNKATLDYFRKRAELLLKLEGADNPKSLSEIETADLIHTLQVQQIELQLQNDELRHGWAKSEVASEKFEALYNGAPSGYVTLTKDGIIDEINFCAAQLLGRDRTRLKNARFGFFITDETKPDFNHFLETLFTGQTKEMCDVTILSDDQSIKYVHITGIVQKNSDYCIITIVDLTEKLRIERELRESEEKYRRFFERATYGIFQSTPEGKAISVNPAFASMFGYDSPADAMQNINNVSKDIFVDPGRRDEIIRLMAEAPYMKIFENIYKRKNGTFFTGILNLIPVYGPDGTFVMMEGFIEDISKRKQAEEALIESEAKYRGLVQNSPDAIVIYVNGIIVFANLEGHRMMEATVPDQLFGKPVLQFVHPGYREKVIGRMEQLLRERAVLPVTEEKFITFNGTEVNVEVKADPINYEQKPAVQLIIRKISGRKHI
jgi:PAS domain S-box-containing protein